MTIRRITYKNGDHNNTSMNNLWLNELWLDDIIAFLRDYVSCYPRSIKPAVLIVTRLYVFNSYSLSNLTHTVSDNNLFSTAGFSFRFVPTKYLCCECYAKRFADQKRMGGPIWVTRAHFYYHSQSNAVFDEPNIFNKAHTGSRIANE